MDDARKRVGMQCVRVTLPELVQLSGFSKLFSLKALKSFDQQSGHRPSKLLARGMEFAESRRYQIGDDIRSIDWRVTARTGRPHTKLFTAEKERQVVLCVDMSTQMFFATQGVCKSVQASLIAGYLAWNAHQQGDKVGSITFNNQEIIEIKPSNRSKSVIATLDRLAYLSGALINNRIEGDISLKQAIESLCRLLKPGAMGVIISDFYAISTETKDLIVQLSRRAEICLFMIEDPFESDIPRGKSLTLRDRETEKHVSTHDSLSLRQYKEQFLERKKNIKDLEVHQNIRFYSCRTNDDCLKLLTKNFR